MAFLKSAISTNSEEFRRRYAHNKKLAAELRQLATQIVMLKQGQVSSFGGVKVLT